MYGECVVKVARALGRLFGIRSFSYTLIREDASADDAQCRLSLAPRTTVVGARLLHSTVR